MLNTLRLKQFRNYDEGEFAFPEGLFGIFGPNGSGKTNILEAISIFSTGRSFRTQHLAEAIQYETPLFTIDAAFTRRSIASSIHIGYDGTEKHIRVGDTSANHFSFVIGHMPSVFFVPKDNELLTGSPAERRRFCNMFLSQGSPHYLYHLTRYQKVLKQRNALLKVKQKQMLPLWDVQFAESASYLMQARTHALSELSDVVNTYYQELSPTQETVSLSYLPSIKSSEEKEILTEMERLWEKDLAIGATSIGPHRDDVSIKLNGKEAKYFASEGQKRSILMALKCAEWSWLRDQDDIPPLFCIDDLLCHLDKKRIERFASLLTTFPQVILTAPEHILLPEKYLSGSLDTQDTIVYKTHT